MTKKRFRDWIDSEPNDLYETEDRFDHRKDEKRYDRKKAQIQDARRTKVKSKFSHMD